MYSNYVMARTPDEVNYVTGRMMDSRRKKVGEYVWRLADDYVRYMVNGRQYEVHDMDLFTTYMADRFGADVLEEGYMAQMSF